MTAELYRLIQPSDTVRSTETGIEYTVVGTFGDFLLCVSPSGKAIPIHTSVAEKVEVAA